MQQKLHTFIQRACPNVPANLQERFAREMVRALKAWVVAPEQAKEVTLEKYQKRIEKKILTPRNVNVELQFSKRRSSDQNAVRQATEKYFGKFFQVVTGFRIDQGFQNGQLSFRIDGIDMDHPKLSVVRCVVSDEALRKKELKRGQGKTNLRKAGRPASIEFDFEPFVVPTGAAAFDIGASAVPTDAATAY